MALNSHDVPGAVDWSHNYSRNVIEGLINGWD